MNTNDNNSRNLQADVIEVGIASLDTAGSAVFGEEIGGLASPGISEDCPGRSHAIAGDSSDG